MNSIINKILTFDDVKVHVLGHAQGCRSYLVADNKSKEALVIDCHLDFVYDISDLLDDNKYILKYVIDTHTHADHPSGALALAELLQNKGIDVIRVAHEKAQHKGVSLCPKDKEKLNLGNNTFIIKHSSGHTPDHIVVYNDKVLFSGDTLLIDSIARTDFLGGDAGELFDILHGFIDNLSSETVLLPGHDYNGKIESTLAKQKANNPWLQLKNRSEFVKQLSANPPPKPANMDTLLKLNREGVNIVSEISVNEVKKLVAKGAATSIIDVRTSGEFATEHVANSILLPVDSIEENLEKVMAIPAPRLLMCQSGNRASNAQKILEKHHIFGTMVITGGMNAYKTVAGSELIKNKNRMSLERQVRIAAGLLVLVGLGLSVVHQGFLFLSAFVGCGLIFAGITDYCGMGMILAKMPWNKVKINELTNNSGGGCSASLPTGGCSASGGCSATPPKK